MLSAGKRLWSLFYRRGLLMTIAHRSLRRYFTDAARKASREARLRRRLVALDPNRPEVFVVRGDEDEHRFAWQIRRFGGVVLSRSHTPYHSILEAEAAGHEALKAYADTLC